MMIYFCIPKKKSLDCILRINYDAGKSVIQRNVVPPGVTQLPGVNAAGGAFWHLRKGLFDF